MGQNIKYLIHTWWKDNKSGQEWRLMHRSLRAQPQWGPEAERQEVSRQQQNMRP